MTENELGRDETTEDDGVVDNPDKIEDETQTVLVMQESEFRSIWSYTVERKGASEEWVIHQICEDLETVGLKEDRIIIKDDQEPAIMDVAKQIALNRRGRFGTAMDNSQVSNIVERKLAELALACIDHAHVALVKIIFVVFVACLRWH